LTDSDARGRAGDILEWLESKKDDMVAELGRLVELESPSTDAAAVNALAAHLVSEWSAAGASVERLPNRGFGDTVRATWGPGREEGQVLVLCHMDTVWGVGEVERRPFVVDGGRAYGPGAYDMKGGIVQALYAVRALGALGVTPRRRVVALMTPDEEVGSPASRELIEREARGSEAVLVAEPANVPDGAVKTFRKGVGVFRMRVRGRSAHAGAAHREGVSAVEELARQVVRLHSYTDYDSGVTVNVGVVRGGTRSNVVAGEAEAEIDLRVCSLEDGERLTNLVLGSVPILAGAEVEVTGGLNRPPLLRSEGVVRLYRVARELAVDLGFELRESSSGGGSDGSFAAAMGVPTLDGLGSVGAGSHSEEEFVVVEEMPRRAALLALMMASL